MLEVSAFRHLWPRAIHHLTTDNMMASEAQLGATLQPEKLDIGQTPPKPLVKPKPRILPKPAFSEKPVTSPLPDVLGCASSPGLYSPKSPLADVPLAEKINILTGPKPYGSSTTAGLGYKRPSFSFKRQKSETAPNEGDAGNATPEEAPDPGARGSWSYSSSMTFSEPPKSFVPWSMHDAGRRKVDQEDLPAAVSPVADADLAARKTGLPPAELTDAAEGTAVRTAGAVTAGRPLEERKPGSFRVKPVPVAVKPGRFPGTTVEEILARLEEGKTAAAQGPDRTWAQRQSLSFDGGCRFGSKAYSSFRRQQSGSEAVGETEEKATKESESKAGKDPSSPSTLEASKELADIFRQIPWKVGQQWLRRIGPVIRDLA
ncbi:182 kDa tankyrase-1-binding protein-like isoform X1 [Rhinatrema bivittatum]|uniref:182 kDa tankyrase-1-binding protein-like isoform X1 n=2 Tax=Rhinatrema bivittatum TaxID=194408 RepID=UPI00112EC21A|nr:182 kDa tankyrase-1-binding protein-like isoform X1 [Rhinatrema bivittatum]